MMTEYRKRYQSMHALHSTSRSPFKRKWHAMETLGQVDKRMKELVFPRKRLALPYTRNLLASPQQNFHTPLSWRRNEASGLKSLTGVSEEPDRKSELGNSVLRRNYKIRVMENENPELQEYKRNVLAATSTPNRKAENSNLQLGPTFSTSKIAEQAGSSSQRPKWEELYESAKSRRPEETVDREAALLEAKLKALQVTRKEAWESAERKRLELRADRRRDAGEAFAKLSREAEEAVDDALSAANAHKLLVLHEQSNIEITGAVMQCLHPGAWLNDEVINLYMELLKERETREPKKFLRCHFFNTFFYNKLFKDKGRYDYKAVRRWTTQKKLGYSLLDCDKIFVPVHKDIHWCLAVIDLRGKKFMYLDSLQGVDEDVLSILSKYITDEAKDKTGKNIDVDSWDHEYPEDIPEQKNGCDCGMFMIKYADFLSRGDTLNFTQEHMNYFRRRTVWELLNLKAN